MQLMGKIPMKSVKEKAINMRNNWKKEEKNQKSILQFVKHLSYKSTALQTSHKCSLTAKGQIKLLQNSSIYPTCEKLHNNPQKISYACYPTLYLLFTISFSFSFWVYDAPCKADVKLMQTCDLFMEHLIWRGKIAVGWKLFPQLSGKMPLHLS